MKITFEVFDLLRNKYVTQDRDWLIDTNGKLIYDDEIGLVAVSQSRYRVDICTNNYIKE